jgi:citrate lyase beta subunit
MEDGVAVNQKTIARRVIPGALQSYGFGRSERLVRINPVGSGLEPDDLNVILRAHPDGIVIPKVTEPGQLIWVEQQITKIENSSDWPAGQIALLAAIESAKALLAIKDIASASPRLQALIFGGEDFSVDIGARRTSENIELLFGRSLVITAAAAYGLQAIDLVYTNFRDTKGLNAECNQGVSLGFSGKQIIHPDQVGPVQEAFTPDDITIAKSLQLIQAYREHQLSGRGVFAIDGKMIDAPIVKAAERILAAARAAGKIFE